MAKAYEEQDFDEADGDYRRWTINGSDLVVAKHPELADKLWLALRGRRPFSFTEEGVI